MWCIFRITLSWFQRRSNKINAILYDKYYLQNCKAITFEKIANYTKYKKRYVRNHLNVFWLNFDIATHSFFHAFSAVGKNRFSKECCLVEWVISFCLGQDDKNLWASCEWGGAWVKMPRIDAFFRNVNSINLYIFPTHGRVFWEKFSKHSGVR